MASGFVCQSNQDVQNVRLRKNVGFILSSTINFILTDGNSSIMAKKEWFNAEIGETDYLFNTSRNITEIKFVLKMSHENFTDIRING